MSTEWYDKDYAPSAQESRMLSPEARMGNAVEYAAHHIGKISRNLERLIAILEKREGKTDGGSF